MDDDIERNLPIGMDAYDAQILNALSLDGRMSITELASEIGLSKTPTQARLRRLEARGVIRGYRAVLDPIRLGKEHVAFVEVKLSDTRESALEAFNVAVLDISEIEEVYLIAGNFDYLMKVRTSTMRAYRRVLAEKISTLPYIASTSTYVAMQEVKDLSPGEGGLGDVT
ncbi:MAG: Lrp/AsnC ligand binding domain-containing protein [Marinovum sp.]|nr:Lrp/AsnC ligand binding domain-containing protein [Marinovum sp.]